MITTVLFDMDGVLLDSENAIRKSSVEALKEYGINALESDFIPFTGMGEQRFIGGVSEKYGVPYQDGMKTLAYKIYGEKHRGDIVIYDGIREMILSLKKAGIKRAVASAADRTKVLINLSCIGLTEDDFDAVITGSDIKEKKPNPEIYLTAAAAVNSAAENCVVVEDAISGIKAGKAAGMYAVGIPGTFDMKDLLSAGAEEIILKTPQILNGIEKLNG